MATDRGFWRSVILLAGLGAAFGGTPVWAEQPLSAIDWLSQSVTVPVVAKPEKPPEPAVTSDALPPDVTVSVLGGPSPDGVGLLPAAVTGLPRALWGLGRTEEIAAAITREQADALPALQSLLITLLLAEADPPADAGGRGVLLLARIDKLLSIGALEQANALLQASDAKSAELFRRSFDVALLTGTEDGACETMQISPDLAPTFPARIFCLARAGDWNAAALTLRTGEALGFVTAEEGVLLSRFLDPDLFDGEPPPPTPAKLTPLVWRMYEAIGEPLATKGLPLAFSHAELREQAGWKAQIEAAERLARVGAIAPNQLLGIYTDRMPAASGGVWDRVDAFQRFDAALTKGDVTAIEQTLPIAWGKMAEVELEVPFAELYADQVSALTLSGDAAGIAFRVGLLAANYERVAAVHKSADEGEAFLIGLARGSVKGVMPQDGMGRAIAAAFEAAVPSDDAAVLMQEQRLGEALLLAIGQIEHGVSGDLRGVTDGLALLRKVGMEDVARRTALELLLLERRG